MMNIAKLAAFLLPAVLCAACDEDITPADENRSAQCGDAGTNHSDSILSEETWLAVASPHHVLTDLVVSAPLTIEPGAVVCVASGSEIRIANLQTNIEGTAARPILFTSRDASGEWAGLELALQGLQHPIVFRNVVIENATRGIFAPAAVVVDSSHFRRISGMGVGMWYYGGGISNSTFDSVGTSVIPAIATESGSFSNNIVRNSGPVTISFGSACMRCATALVERLTIQSARGRGLVIQAADVTVRNVVVTGSLGAGIHAMTIGLRLQNCSVTGNAGGGILVERTNVQIVDCNIVGNQQFGLRSMSVATEARSNFWGSAGGPSDPANNRVEGDVQFEPFRTTPVQF